MMHSQRKWCVSKVSTPEELARKLTESTWTLCTAFQVAGHDDYLFLNDSTCEDAAAEFAVVKGGLASEQHEQIESITFSWCRYEAALQHVNRALAGQDDCNSFRRVVQPTLQTPEQHGRCPLCA